MQWSASAGTGGAGAGTVVGGSAGLGSVGGGGGGGGGTGDGSLALTALSHLLVFDALGAFLCVGVDVLGNFEVWKRASVRHPFGYVKI